MIESTEGKVRREQLHTLIRYWNTHAQFKRWIKFPSKSAIQPLMIGSNHDVLKISKELQDTGYWVPAIRPPTVPKDLARLRISLNAEHTLGHLDDLLEQLFKIESACR